MKRLILCCDGSWHAADRARPSNVLHFARLISPRDKYGVEQITYYQGGVGTDSTVRLRAGLSGADIDTDIQDLYRFLVHNYIAGDEIWCFGYSRGAYTVRSLIGLLRNAWLLAKSEAHRISGAYHIYRTKWGADADNAVRFRNRWCQPVKIRFLGVWDTVGTLGIPLPILRGLGEGRYAFHDTRLSRIVTNARHALAIDERRIAFTPTLWHTGSTRTHTEQCWFAGSHADLGGGQSENGLAMFSLDWLVSQANAFGLATDPEYLERARHAAGREIVHRSNRGACAAGSAWRPLGEANNDETIHASAEQRMLRDKRYRPQNLTEYLAKHEQLRLPL